MTTACSTSGAWTSPPRSCWSPRAGAQRPAGSTLRRSVWNWTSAARSESMRTYRAATRESGRPEMSLAPQYVYLVAAQGAAMVDNAFDRAGHVCGVQSRVCLQFDEWRCRSVSIAFASSNPTPADPMGRRANSDFRAWPIDDSGGTPITEAVVISAEAFVSMHQYALQVRGDRFLMHRITVTGD